MHSDFDCYLFCLFVEHMMLQVRDERGLVGTAGSLDTSDAASVLEGGGELDKFLRAALAARSEEEKEIG